MIAFEVKDMTCGHCVGAITRAVKAVDGDAQVQIDLAAHRVDIATSKVDAAALSDAIEQAGYSPVALDAAAGRDPGGPPPQRTGCCCRQTASATRGAPSAQAL